MKIQFLLISYCSLLLSCNSQTDNKNKSSYSDFEVQIDTIQVDSGSEIVMAGADLQNPAISKDKAKFYSWDRKNYALEIIDLQSYKLENKVHFDKEGPKGLQSDHLFYTKPLPKARFGFEDNESFKIHDLEGNLFKKVHFEEEWITQDLTESESFELVAVNDLGTKLAGIHFGFDQYKAMMFLLDIEDEKKESIPLPEFQKLENYRIIFHKNGTYLTSVNPKIYINFQGDSIILSNNHFNDLYIYKEGELRYQSFEHQLIAEGKEKQYRNKSESREEVVQMVYDMNTEISFTRFLWDEKNDFFYRFSNQAVYAEGIDEPTWKVSVMLYDKDLNLTGEKEVMTFNTYAEPLFVKNGKVHFHLNIEDELGFIRMSLKN